MIATVKADNFTRRRTGPQRLVQVTGECTLAEARDFARSKNNMFLPVVVRLSGGRFAVYRPIEPGERCEVETIEAKRIVRVAAWNREDDELGGHADHIDLLIWDTQRYLRYADAARTLGVNKTAITRYVQTKKLTDYRCQSIRLVDMEEVGKIKPGEVYNRKEMEK